MVSTAEFKEFATQFNDLIKNYNFHVAPVKMAGNPGRNDKSVREFRLQLIDKHRDTSDKLKDNLVKIVKDHIPDAKNIVFNKLSPNSSKYSSVSFRLKDQGFDLVIARGANKGEIFEVSVTKNLASVFKTQRGSPDYMKLIDQLNESHVGFKNVEIKTAKQRTGNTRKTSVPVEKLGEVIGDIILTDTTGKNWFVSLKDVNGATFSSFPGGATLFDSKGNIQPKSDAGKFLDAFGVDLTDVQKGFDERNRHKVIRPPIKGNKRTAPSQIKSYFEHAWGMNYFYVRKQSSGWEVFWLDRKKLNELSTVKVTKITYPGLNTKSITIFCESPIKKYKIEIRNAKGGEYPNEIKFKVLK